MRDLGDREEGAVFNFHFNTNNSTGEGVTLTNSLVSVYKSDSAVETTTGVTISTDFDSISGLHKVEIDTSDSFYQAGNDYSVILTSGTVDGVNVAGSQIAQFSIENRWTENSTSVGGAINFECTEDNTGSAIDPSSATFVGSVVGGTFANLSANDGTLHEIEDTANDIDIVYGFNVGGGKIATSVQIVANVDGNGDEIKVKVYDHNGATWDTIGTVLGAGGTTYVNLQPALFSKHTGTGSESGKVYIRFETDSTTPSNLDVDLLIVAAINTDQTAGYSNGFIYFNDSASNTGSEIYVDGTADNPVSSWSAVASLKSALGLNKLDVVGTLTPTSTLETFTVVNGHNSILNLSTATDCGGVEFINFADIYGTMTSTGERPNIYDSLIAGSSGLTTVPIRAENTRIGEGGVTGSSSGVWSLHDCGSSVTGTSYPFIDFATIGNHDISISKWTRGLLLSGLVSTDSASLNGDFNTLAIQGTAGQVNVGGMYGSLDNLLVDDSNLFVDNAFRKRDATGYINASVYET